MLPFCHESHTALSICWAQVGKVENLCHVAVNHITIANSQHLTGTWDLVIFSGQMQKHKATNQPSHHSGVPLHTGLVSVTDEQLPAVGSSIHGMGHPHGSCLWVADAKVGQSQSLQGLGTEEGSQMGYVCISEPGEL